MLFRSKQRAARKFLESGNKVKLTVRFKGREMARPELGEKLLDSFFQGLSDIATKEQAPQMAGRDISIVVAQAKQSSKIAPDQEKQEHNDAKD